MRRVLCIGFGPREGICMNTAGSTHSKLWCQACDEARRAHITAQLQRLTRPAEHEQGHRP